MSGLVQGAGVLCVCGLAALALAGPSARTRAAAMVSALALLFPLLVAELWDREELRALREDTARLAVIVAVGALALVILILVMRRRPEALPLAIVALLPFRIPLGTEGQTANLLLPLYAVIAAGAFLAAWNAWSSRNSHTVSPTGGPAKGPPSRATPVAQRWGIVAGTGPVGKAASALVFFLAASVVLYGIQATYSTDIDKATETAAFFLVPFALMLRLLLDSRWTPRLMTLVLAVVVAEALVLALIGFGQAATRHLFWNEEVITANEFHSYFRVNSLFWDPNIFGRYLALVIVGLATVGLWARNRREVLLAAGASAVLWAALAMTYSQSSLTALLAALTVLAALRWSVRWTAVVGVVGAALALAYVVASPNDIKIRVDSAQALDKSTSGRADLVLGGVELARRRPLWGFGSGSFVQSFREESKRDTSVAASHTEPVTIAAEQGAIGLGLYLALLAVALAVLFGALRGVAPGLPDRDEASPAGRAPHWYLVARVAVAAAFVAMVVHSLTYAAFLSDPLTWTLLGLGIVLAGGPALALAESAAPEARRPPADAAAPS